MYYKTMNPTLLSFCLSFLGGIFYAIGFPSVITKSTLFFMPIIGLFIFFTQLSFFKKKPQKDHGLKKDLLCWIFLSFGYNAFGYYWIPNFLNEFGEITGPLNFFTYLIFSFILLPHILIFILLLKTHFIQDSLKKIDPRQQSLILSLGLVLLEYYTPQQFPAHIGHPWLGLAPYLGLAPLFGAPLFSFFSFWPIFSCIHFFHCRKKRPYFVIFSFSIFLLCNFLLKIPSSKLSLSNKKELKVRLVQANIGNLLKLDSESGEKHSVSSVIKRHFDLSTREPKEGIDLIIWPETSYPLLLSADKMKKDKRYIPPAIKSVIKETGADIFFGGYDRAKGKAQGTFKSEYNSAFLISSEGEFVNGYHKHKLIPFGEGLPFGPLNQFLSRYIKNISFFAEGDTFPLFKTKKDSSFISAICYEILFSSFIRNYLNQLNEQPQFLINLTNDSWYGDTLEPYQHLFLSHWRAIEFDLPIIRMTNTGISSILYPNGEEDRRTNIFKKVSKDYTFVYKSERSYNFFQKLCLVGGYLLCLFLMAVQTLLHFFEKKKFDLQFRKEKPSFKRS